MRTKPVESFRRGAIGLSVWQREGKHGTYFDFTLSRCYQKPDGQYTYSNSFHESNADAMKSVIAEAAAWVVEHRKNAGLPSVITANESSPEQEAHE